MSDFYVHAARNGGYYFVVKAPNGEVILTSQVYGQLPETYRGIKSVIANSSKREQYQRYLTARGQYYFVLKAKNGKVLGTSQMYKSSAGREKGIHAVAEISETSNICVVEQVK